MTTQTSTDRIRTFATAEHVLATVPIAEADALAAIALGEAIRIARGEILDGATDAEYPALVAAYRERTAELASA